MPFQPVPLLIFPQLQLPAEPPVPAIFLIWPDQAPTVIQPTQLMVLHHRLLTQTPLVALILPAILRQQALQLLTTGFTQPHPEVRITAFILQLAMTYLLSRQTKSFISMPQPQQTRAQQVF